MPGARPGKARFEIRQTPVRVNAGFAESAPARRESTEVGRSGRPRAFPVVAAEPPTWCFPDENRTLATQSFRLRRILATGGRFLPNHRRPSGPSRMRRATRGARPHAAGRLILRRRRFNDDRKNHGQNKPSSTRIRAESARSGPLSRRRAERPRISPGRQLAVLVILF